MIFQRGRKSYLYTSRNPRNYPRILKSQSDDNLKKHLIIEGRFVRGERAILVPQELRTLRNSNGRMMDK